MKRLLIMGLLLTGIAASAQNDSLQYTAQEGETPAKNVRFITNLRVLFIKPDGVADNYVSKGYKGRFGLGLKVDFFEVYNFSFGTVGEFLSYKVANSAYGGDTGIIINNFSIEAIYKLPVTRHMTVYPKVFGGYSIFRYDTNSDSAVQNGPRLGIGSYIDYRLTKRLALCAGADYSLTYPGVKTNSSYEDFFGRVQQLNFSLGLKVNIRD